MRALLVSTYELGRQPFGLASPAAWLRREGFDVTCVDVSREPLPLDLARDAELVAFYLPMHTATRLAAPLIRKVRQVNPLARISAYGLYAPLNDAWLRELGVDDVLGGEFESDLASIARRMSSADRTSPVMEATRVDLSAALPRLQFLVPDRSGLPPLERYATLERNDGRRTVVGYTEASRGCRHLCRHCPVVPVYNGQFRLIQTEVVAADIASQVAAGAGHITFGDPDFFNGPTHAVRIVTALHDAHPDVTYDVTIKVEHLLKHRHLLSTLADTGCAFVTTAVESLDDRVLAILEKGHTRADFFEAVGLCRTAGLTIAPTFVAFHPWLTLDAYCDLVDSIAALDLVDHIAPIQLAIRLLVPAGSRLLELEEVRALAGTFDPRTLTYRWRHQDPRVDRLHEEVNRLVGSRLTADRRVVFGELHALAHARADRPTSTWLPKAERATVPYLTEPWYCCAEPSPEQVGLV